MAYLQYKVHTDDAVLIHQCHLFIALPGLSSIDVGNSYLKHKNPYKAMAMEKRMLQARAGGCVLQVGKILTQTI